MAITNRTTLLISSIIGICVLVQCSVPPTSTEEEPTQKVKTQNAIEKPSIEEKEPLVLSARDKHVLKLRVKELKSFKDKLVAVSYTNGAEIGQLNRDIRAIRPLPSSLSSDFREVRLTKVLEVFITDMGIAKATYNEQLMKIAVEDWKRTSRNLDELLTSER